MNSASGHAGGRFTVWGGALVIVAGVLMLLDRGGAFLTIDQVSVFPFGGTIAHLVIAIVLCAGFVVVAVGRRGGTHLTGSSGAGRSSSASSVPSWFSKRSS